MAVQVFFKSVFQCRKNFFSLLYAKYLGFAVYRVHIFILSLPNGRVKRVLPAFTFARSMRTSGGTDFSLLPLLGTRTGGLKTVGMAISRSIIDHTPAGKVKLP
jgi:hypothetical protein